MDENTPAPGQQPPVPAWSPTVSVPVPAVSGHPAPDPSGKPPGRLPGSRRTRLIALAAAVALAGGAGIGWYVLADDEDLMSHVEISGGKQVTGDDTEDEDCDDYDEYTYNDCDSEDDSDDDTYEFIYKVTNKGDGPANYTAIINAFDKDGDYIGQTYILVGHLKPGKSEADTEELSSYSMEDDNEVADIATVKLAHVERTALAN
ncbi:hypothetical protein [Streptomyces sp. XD-27]|uniref:hypothetical protein n=1 Tax=Streptomyces sp. XD-27 TaxID=3062779 RepID=UPI0026F4580C|nr:hypothetical protein [Streptomyces sp. XD-27]WKX73323.1 hypothetical protein Q3Y56_28560 [Streptomyces sp. XD-27]